MTLSFLLLQLFLVLPLTVYCQFGGNRHQPWFIETAIADIGKKYRSASNAAFDAKNGVLAVFSDGDKSIRVFNTSLQRNFSSVDAYLLKIEDSAYPKGEYGLFASSNGFVVYCESDSASLCVKIDLLTGSTKPGYIIHSSLGKHAPSIFMPSSPSKQFLLSFSYKYGFSYFSSNDYRQVNGKSILEAKTRPDGYIAGPTFEVDDFVYVIWLRSATSSEETAEKLVNIGRFCTGSPDFNFYVEIAVKSPLNGFSKRNVTATIFGEIIAISSRSSPNELSLCFVRKSSVVENAENAVKLCANGSSLESPGFAASDSNAALNCKQKRVQRNARTGCGEPAFFAAQNAFDCESPIKFDLADAGVSTFVDSASLVISEKSALLIFTDVNGRFVKVHVFTDDDDDGKKTLRSKVISVDKISTTAGPFEPDERVVRMFLQESYAQLVFVTSQRVIRMPASNCSQYYSCGACVAAEDPLCAWCPSTGTCSLTIPGASTCTDMILSSSRQSAIQCPRLTAGDIDLDKTKEIKLHLDPWPFKDSSPSSFNCHFGGNILSTSGSYRPDTNAITCRIPSAIAELPLKIIPVELSAVFNYETNNKIPIAELNVTLFKCSKLLNCSSCAGGLEGRCLWCFGSGQCLSANESQCRNLALRSEHNCPVLAGIVDPARNDPPPLTYSFGSNYAPKILHFPIQRGRQILNQSGILQCQFNYAGHTYAGPFSAYISPTGYVDCSLDGFPVPNNVSLLPADGRQVVLEAVVTSNGHRIDAKRGTDMTIRFFSCSPSAYATASLNTCGHCRALSKTWGCVWCESSRCVPSMECSDQVSVGAPCVAKVKKFSPERGPLQGETMLTISTVDLDSPLERLKVFVAGIECAVDSERTKLPDTVVCFTGRVDDSSRKGRIRVLGGNDNNAAESSNVYRYEPVLQRRNSRIEIQPTFGPIKGGTPVVIIGSDIDFGIGKNRYVWIGSRPCLNLEMIRRNVLQCETSEAAEHGQATVHVSIDGFNSTEALAAKELLWQVPTFEYRLLPNPMVVPAYSTWKTVNIARKGGSLIRVIGQNLDSSASTIFIIRLKNNKKDFTSPCFVVSSEELYCRSPSLNNKMLVTIHDIYDYGIRFSKQVVFWSSQARNWPLLNITADPVYAKATIDENSGYVTITGTNLNDSYVSSDYNITIADRQCVIETLGSAVVSCKIPLRPAGNGSDSAVSPSTTDYVPLENLLHSNVEIVLGSIQPPVVVELVSKVDGTDYENAFKHLISSSLPIIIPSIIGFFIVLVIIILVACICSRAKRQKSMRKFETTKNGIVTQQQQQLTKFHRRIFADQTQVAAQEVRWNAELPFHKYRDYCQNFFFPLVDDYRSLQTPPDVANIGLAELERFHQLLLRKNFLIAFVCAFENPHYFRHTDITRVAALLSVVLQPNMVYFTDVIRTLLDDLIARTVQRNPAEVKQLLRRAEHVVERLLANWLAMLLYDHVLAGPGQALFRLTRACHLKTTSGKIDPVTGRSLYALSERNLLQDPSEPLEITLNVFDIVRSAIQSEAGRRTVTVLDCDTVPQAKAKILDAIYEGVPFSARLTPADCDLQFVQPDGKRVDLPDDSQKGTGTLSTSKASKPVLIKSFAIENNTKVIIIRRPAGTYGTNTTSLKSVVSQSSTGGGVGGGAGSSTSADSHSLLNGSPLMPNEEQKTPGGSRRVGLLNNNRRRSGSERGEKRTSRSSNASSAVASIAHESTAPPSEYFLSLLLITKKSLQEHIDGLFTSIFRLQPPKDSIFPLAIRYLFDLFDELGKKHGITDAEVLYCWKTNAVPLRFWVNLIQNPDYLLDHEVSDPVKHCLSVVNQALMDSCARDPQPLSHRSASNKQLFSEDVMRYRGYVQKYYGDIQDVALNDSLDIIMHDYLTTQSHLHARAFDPQGALRRLAGAALRYSGDIQRTLRTGAQLPVPMTDGEALADEFAQVVQDLRIAGIGSLPNTNSGHYFNTSGTSHSTATNGNVSFTATPIATNGVAVIGSNRPNRSTPSQQQQITTSVSGYQLHQNQYIVTTHPTHHV